MNLQVFTRTQTGIPVFSYQFDYSLSAPNVLVLGGVHGDEPEGIIAAQGLLAAFTTKFDLAINLTLIPEFNPEGILNKQRMNSKGIDLNRNLPTKDWSSEAKTPRYFPGYEPNSEPENKALVTWINKNKPSLIISLHSWNPMININGPDCEPEASILEKHTGYPIEPDIGYPTPGSLGTFAGKERNISTITFEIQRDIEFSMINRIHVPALIDALKNSHKRGS